MALAIDLEVIVAERKQESSSADDIDDFFEPVLGEAAEDDLEELIPVSTEKQRLAEKRRRAEQRLEERRLRDELGFYDLQLDDF